MTNYRPDGIKHVTEHGMTGVSYEDAQLYNREEHEMKMIQLYARRKTGEYVMPRHQQSLFRNHIVEDDVDESDVIMARFGSNDDLLREGEQVEISDNVLERAVDAFFSYGGHIGDWKYAPREAMKAALRAAAGVSIPIDTQAVGAFLAGEGTLTLEACQRMSKQLGYEAMSGDGGLPGETPLMVSMAPTE